MSESQKFQLVFEFRGDDPENFERVLAVESQLEQTLQAGEVDGNDVGLAGRPVDRVAIERYLKDDGRPLAESEREDTLNAYETAHSKLAEWCAAVRPGTFGVLHLSF